MILLVLLSWLWSFGQSKLHPESQVYLKVSEPSDLSFRTAKNSMYCVSDGGKVYEIAITGEVLRKAPFDGGDLEGIAVGPEGVYVVDERFRKVTLLDSNTLQPLKSWTLQHQGPRNSGYEGICWDETKGVFWLVTEKNPILIEQYDRNFNLLSSKTWHGASDVSALTVHQGNLWLLSDEDREIWNVSSQDLQVISKRKIKATTPEGLCFVAPNRFAIVNDDSAILSFFNLPNP